MNSTRAQSRAQSRGTRTLVRRDTSDNTLSRRDQDMLYEIGNDCLQARFKQLIPEIRAYYPPTYPVEYIKEKNLNHSPYQ